MNTKIIKNKIKSTGSIKKITRTMEMVSVAKMKKAVAAADGYKSFGIEAKKIFNILGDQREKHVLSTENKLDNKNIEIKNILIILIAGQKGLCGGYNSNLYRYIYKNHALEKSNLKFITIGKYGEKIAKKFDDASKDGEGKDIIMSFSGKEFLSADARVIIKKIISEYKENKYKQVKLIYTDFTNVNTQSVAENIMLPFSKNTIDQKPSEAGQTVLKKETLTDDLEYTFEPNISEVFEYAVNVLLQNIISGSVTRARAAEHAARMMAMKTATDNAGEMLKELKTYFNKARQSAITQEIAEISSGAMASGK